MVNSSGRVNAKTAFVQRNHAVVEVIDLQDIRARAVVRTVLGQVVGDVVTRNITLWMAYIEYQLNSDDTRRDNRI